MKGNKFIILLSLFLLFSCSKTKSPFFNSKKDEAGVLIEKRIIDIGKIHSKNNGFLYQTFKLQNKENRPLIIQRVNVSCGCLSVVKYTNYPVKYDSIAIIQIRIDPQKVNGTFQKNIFVETNTESVILLKIKGESL